MSKYSRILCAFVCVSLLLVGCDFLDEETYWIKENIPAQITPTEVATIPTPAETAATIPTQLQMNTEVIAEGDLRFFADTTALCNDLGVYLQRQLDADLWLQEKEALTPYSRTPATYRRMEFDPMVKNEPLLCVYTSEAEELYEVSVILLTHDWTEAGEEQFLRLGVVLLQCFWPDCAEETILETVSKIREDINHNVYPDNSASPRPMTVYVCGNTAAYGYTHGAHISINVIPVTENRLREMETAGVQIVNIP